MNIEQSGDNLVIHEVNQAILQMSRELPGRRRWKDGSLWIQGTADNIRHLMDVFPVVTEMDLPAIQRVMGVEAELAKNTIARQLPPEASAFKFKTTPYSQQLQAFGVSRSSEFFGLFMEMGTGKSKVIIDTAAALWLEGRINRVMILAPMGVHRQWVEEQFPTHMRDDVEWCGHIYYAGLGVKESRRWDQDLKDKSKLQVYTMAFPSLSSDTAAKFMNRVIFDGPTLFVLDESHMIKNPSAKRTKAVLKVAEAAAFRRILTGTPITQGIEDLFTQLKFLHPDILGLNSYYAFRNRYCVTQQIPGAPAGAVRIVGYQNEREIKEKLAGCTFEARKDDCLDLPDKIYKTHFVDLTPAQRKLYNQLKDDLVAQIDNGTLIEAPLAITQMMKMQQVISGHLIDEEGEVHELETNRIKAVLDILGDRKSAIVWTRFRNDIERLRKEIEAAGYSVGCYYGDTSEAERHRITRPGAVDVLIANPASAGTGLNLTHYDTAIYYANSFNAAERWQSEDRIHRIGQDNHCVYVDLQSPDTMDAKVIKALVTKKGLAATIQDLREVLV